MAASGSSMKFLLAVLVLLSCYVSSASAVAPIVLDTFWQAFVWVVYMLFVFGWGWVWIFWKLIDGLEEPAIGMPGRLMYYAIWIIIHVFWGFAGFLIWFTPDPLLPAAPGTWGTWPLVLLFVVLVPIGVALFHYVFWRWKRFGLAWFFLLLSLIFQIVALALAIFIVGATNMGIAIFVGVIIVYALSILWTLYILYLFWMIMRCNDDRKYRDWTVCYPDVVKRGCVGAADRDIYADANRGDAGLNPPGGPFSNAPIQTLLGDGNPHYGAAQARVAAALKLFDKDQ